MEKCVVCGELRVKPDPADDQQYYCGYCGMRYRVCDLPAMRSGDIAAVPGTLEKIAELAQTGFEECGDCRYETAAAIFCVLMRAHPELACGWWGMLTVLSKDFNPCKLSVGRITRKETDEFSRLLDRCGDILSQEQLELAEHFRACADLIYEAYEKKSAGFAALKELRAHPDDEQFIRRHRQAADAYHEVLEACRKLEAWLKESYLQRNGELPQT